MPFKCALNAFVVRATKWHKGLLLLLLRLVSFERHPQSGASEPFGQACRRAHLRPQVTRASLARNFSPAISHCTTRMRQQTGGWQSAPIDQRQIEAPFMRRIHSLGARRTCCAFTINQDLLLRLWPQIRAAYCHCQCVPLLHAAACYATRAR